MDIVCANCGNKHAKLLTRQNPKGVTGVFWCEICTGEEHLCKTEGDTLVAAIEGTEKEI